jgi:hypothetical protein
MNEVLHPTRSSESFEETSATNSDVFLVVGRACTGALFPTLYTEIQATAAYARARD